MLTGLPGITPTHSLDFENCYYNIFITHRGGGGGGVVCAQIAYMILYSFFYYNVLHYEIIEYHNNYRTLLYNHEPTL